jgi:hypothetical protein
MLRDKRKLFTITTVYDPNFIFPGASLPGPEAPRLTEAKSYNEREYGVGDFDPEWIAPDIDNLSLGEYNGRFYYSIRDDIPTELSTLGNFTENVDPKVLTTVPQDVYDAILDMPSLRDIKIMEGLYSSAEEAFSKQYPTLEDLQKGLKDDPNLVTDFNTTYEKKVSDVLVKLGIVLQS